MKQRLSGEFRYVLSILSIQLLAFSAILLIDNHLAIIYSKKRSAFLDIPANLYTELILALLFILSIWACKKSMQIRIKKPLTIIAIIEIVIQPIAFILSAIGMVDNYTSMQYHLVKSLIFHLSVSREIQLIFLLFFLAPLYYSAIKYTPPNWPNKTE